MFSFCFTRKLKKKYFLLCCLIASVYGAMIPFMMVPTLLNVANALKILNTTDDKPLLFRVDYFVDVETYYYPLLIHSYFATIGYITIVVAMDTINLLYVQHACALCTILGYNFYFNIYIPIYLYISFVLIPINLF